MQNLINRIQLLYPGLKFIGADRFYWSPESKEIFYNIRTKGHKAVWSLLHETGHALLGHESYKADFELILLEVAAWERAEQLATKLGIEIDNDHIQDCLDTYRDWLHRRSICPHCTTKSLQQGDFVHYRCFNCHTSWRVTANRFCRAYRQHKNVNQIPSFHALS